MSVIDKAKFWDKAAYKYAAKPVDDAEAYRIKLEMTREYFTPQSHVYEFGCGTESTAIAHAPYVDRIDATDVSQRMIDIARAKARAVEIDNVHFSVVDFPDTQLEMGVYDVVMAHSVLQFVDDLPQTLEASAKLLKDGGYLVSSTVCLGERHNFLRPIIAFMRLIRKAPFVRFLKADELEEKMQAAGFQIVQHWHPKGNAAVFLIAKKQPQNRR